MIKRITALLTAVTLLLTLCACGDKPEETDGDTTQAQEETTAPAKEGLKIFADGKSDYVIVYPEGCGSELFAAVRDLQEAIENISGVKLDICEEGTDTPAGDSTACEILVGNTSRSESAAVYEQMPDKGAYAVVCVGNKLVMYGANAQMGAKAVDHFIKKILRPNMEELYFTPEDNYYNERIGVITSVMIDGTELDNFRIVVPANGYAEQYAAELFCDYLFTYYGGQTPRVVSDDTEAKENEIVIGKTNRGGSETDSGKYKISVDGGKIYAVADSATGYIEVFNALKKVIPQSQSKTVIENGALWSGDITQLQTNDQADMSFMFHNVLGYVEKYPAANRPDMALQIYLEYMPDIIGMQEAGQSYYRSYAQKLWSGLADAGYVEIVFKDKGGTGNPIFYNSNTLTLKESGYSRARSGDKGTTWAVFDTKDGKQIAVTNSHFAANSNASGDATKGNQYRVQDAENLLTVVSTIKSKYPNIPIVNGGDFNSSMSTDPGKTLTDGGLVHATSVAAESADYSAWIGYPVYDDDKGYYLPRAFTWANIAGALDHIMLGGETSGVNVLEYAVLNDRISCVVSDHLPQILYFSWK